MNKISINPISLIDVMIAPAEVWADGGDVFEPVCFDSRSDCLLSPKHGALAVCMEFCNERHLADSRSAGVRRRVSVAITDATLSRVIGREEVTVCLRKGELLRKKEVYVRFDPAAICTEHRYKVTVSDVTSRKGLGEKTFRFFRRRYCGWAPDELLEVTEGCLADYFTYVEYRAVPSNRKETFRLRFNLRPRVDEPLENLPEVEVRIYLPDESIESRYVALRSDDAGTVYAEVPFRPADDQRGVTYAELRCLGEAFGGMVFSTNGDIAYGNSTGEAVLPLDRYTYHDAVARFNSLIYDGKTEADADDDEEFERRLDAFIASETEETSEPEEAEEAEEEPQPSLAEMMAGLTGLGRVKERLATYEKMVQFNRLRSESGLPVLSLPLHAMFLGSPGTGKTTVAKMMGKMLAAAGVLSKGHVVVRERASLLGQYYNSEATKTQEAIEEAQGGILLIDEAYQLYQPQDTKDPGKFVIETLLTALSDESNRDWMLILAGYPDEMQQMFRMNPGLKSRIPESNIYTFDDYSEEELMEIAEKYLERHDYSLSAEARRALAGRLQSECSHRDRNFGNARHVINMIQTDIIPAMAVRIISSGAATPEALSRIEAADIPAAMQPRRQSRPRVGYCQ